MTRHEKVGLEAIKIVLLPHGFDVQYEVRSTHHAARIERDGTTYRLPLIGSGRAGDHEVATYARQNAQRFLRSYYDTHAPIPPAPADTVKTFSVVKRSRKFSIVCVETGEMVYSVPDFLYPYIRNRQGLNELAGKLTGGDKDIRAITVFETSLRPN